MKILDLGCGLRKVPGAIGADRLPGSDADILMDLDAVPYPFKENQFDRVECLNTLEHAKEIVPVIREIHRILVPGGLLHIVVPHFSSLHAFSDLTHRHFFSSQSLDHFCGLFEEYRHYALPLFEKKACRLHFWKLGRPVLP